jgi:hypothetical protein
MTHYATQPWVNLAVFFFVTFVNKHYVYKWSNFRLFPPSWSSSHLTAVSQMRSSSPPTSLRRSQRLRGDKSVSSSNPSLRLPRSHSRDWLRFVKMRTHLRAGMSSVLTPASLTSDALGEPPTPPLPLQLLTRFSSSPLSSPGEISSSHPSPNLGTTPAAPFQHMGQGPNGTNGSSLPVGTMCYSAAPSVGSIVVNTAPYHLAGSTMGVPPPPNPGTFWYSPTMPSAYDAGTRMVTGPTQHPGFDLVSSYTGLLIYFIS